MSTCSHRSQVQPQEVSRRQRASSRGRLRGSVVTAILALIMAMPALVAAPATAQTSEVDAGVRRLYCAYFLREPDQGGMEYWVGLRDQGVALEAVAANFALSQEFRNTYGKQVSTDAFVSLIYRNLFERTPDPGGFDYWVDLIDGGLDRGIVMTYFSESQEYKNRIVAVGCSGSGSGEDVGGNTDPGVAARLANATTWTTPTKVSVDDRPLRQITSEPKIKDDVRVRTTCMPQGLPPLSRTFTEFPAYAFSGPTMPGLIVEGAGIPDGDLRVVPLGRSSIQLASTAASENPIRNLSAPTTDSVQKAVTELKRDADARLTGIDVTASDITFTKQEVHSYQQASLQAGVSLHYESVSVDAKFDLDFKQTSAEERHSIVVRLVQPMFDVRMALDNFVSPEDFFAASVSEEDVRQLETTGRLSAENPPVLIDTVSYGRIMMFTMTSTTATSASELEIAVSGAYGNISGEGSLTTRQRNLLSTSSVQMAAYGGEQGLALAAIKSGDLSEFFGPANTATAAPLTMSIRTLNGRQIDVADHATLQRIACTDDAAYYRVRVEVRDLFHANANVLVNGKQVNASTITPPNKTGQAFGLNLSSDLLRPGWNDIQFQLRDGTCAWPFDNEQMKAFVYTRGDVSQPWGGAKWTESFDGTACFFDWDMQVNTTTGEVK